MSSTVRVLMVCLGNICRSPTAEGVFRSQIASRQLEHMIKVDSAGTSNWHIDAPPDSRSSRAAAMRGYNLSGMRGRQVADEDFQKFDYIIAMDSENLAELKRRCPPECAHKLSLLLTYGSNSDYQEVPDPYYSGESGFELVLDLIEASSAALLDQIQHEHELA